MRIGDILVQENLITPEQLEEALELQKKDPRPLGQILIDLGYVNEEAVAIALSKKLSIPYFSWASGMLKMAKGQGLEKIIPYEMASHYLVFPISKQGNVLTCAMADPLDMWALEHISKTTGYDVQRVVSTPTDIKKAINTFYKGADVVKSVIDTVEESVDLDDVGGDDVSSRSIDSLKSLAEEAPVVHLVDLIIREAIKQNASDIHIEPQRDKVMVRYRIDGLLYEMPGPPKRLHMPVVSRIKIMSRLDIAEKRLPQDGAMSVKVDNRVIDLRVSTVPTIWGEKVVLRILDKSRVPLDLSKLGFSASDLEAFRKAIHSPYGLVFLTGPTGSGKTTTLYAALNEINSIHKNIMTVEDPVEYQLDGINQVSIKPSIGLTFARVLRAFLRQDPDIIMVGEVRDLETAEICIRAALTGHLVLSTLHTNDAPSAITRLIDMGVEPFLLMPSLLIVVAQRLVRVLCPKCKEAYEPKVVGDKVSEILLKEGIDLAYRAKGCEHCNYSGYKGRIAIHEILVVDEEIRKLIGKRASSDEIKRIAIDRGMSTLWKSAMKRVAEGITSVEEAISATL